MRDEALVAQINHEHCNGRYLPNYAMNPAVRASTDLQAVLADAELVLIAIPSKAFRSVVLAAKVCLGLSRYWSARPKGSSRIAFVDEPSA
jgi:glycerol-3-phosphate dehydrogenase (NAD(P)+)